ncbi:MAG TPA: hypothetical protein VF525_07970 [Pyrinomonadaceae bacterium]
MCGLVVTLELLERYARNQTPPPGAGWVNVALRECNGHEQVKRWLERARAPARAAPALLDPANCPDCEGRGLYYPDGARGGVAKCAHKGLRARLAERAQVEAQGHDPPAARAP